MKKRVVILIAVLAVLASCIAFSTLAADNTVTHRCEACKQDVTWTALTPSVGGSLTAGHHHLYLSQSYTDTQTSQIVVNSGVTLCLDLYGNSFATNGRSMIAFNGSVIHVMDSSSAQTGTINGSTGGNNPGGGTISVDTGGQFNLHSGTLKLTKVDRNHGVGRGGVVQVSGGGTLNVLGGRIEGAQMVMSSYFNDDANDGCGGAVYVRPNGTVNISGGTITSGSVPYSPYTFSGEGPCIYLENAASKLTLSGAANVEEIYYNIGGTKITISGTYTGTTSLRMRTGAGIGTAVANVAGADISGATIRCGNGTGYNTTKNGDNLVLSSFTPTTALHVCQHCKSIVSWLPLEGNTSAFSTAGKHHLYLSAEYTGAQLVLSNKAQICLDLYGQNITTNGRAVYVDNGTALNLMDTQSGGYICGSTGGNNPDGGTLAVNTSGVCNLYSGTLKFTKVNRNHGTGRGGIVYLKGTLNVYGGTLQGGDMAISTYYTQTYNGYGGAVYAVNNSKLNVYGGKITSGTVPTGCGAPCIFVEGTGTKVCLAGAAQAEEIYFVADSSASLSTIGTYTGKASLYYKPDKVSVAEGMTVGSCTGSDISGAELTCSNGSGYSVFSEDSKLKITGYGADIVAVTHNTAASTGYTTLQEAIDNCTDGYVQMLRATAENVTVAKDLYIDLNGQHITGTVTVKDGATIYGKDVKTDDYAVSDGVYGQLESVVLEGTGTVTGMEAGTALAQDSYLLVNESGKLSFHRVTLKIHTMTLRPDKAGLYYKSDFLGDEKVAATVSQYGIAMSVVSTPTAENMGTTSKCTVFTGFASGVNANLGNASSTLLKGILKDGNTDAVNKRNLEMAVYGRAYVKTTDGRYVFGKMVSRSLAEQMTGVDGVVNKLSQTQMEAVIAMYNQFKSVLKDRGLVNIADAVQTQEEGTLKILGLGHSHGLDGTNLLYEVFHNEMPDKKVLVGALYYSGCNMYQHADHLTNNKPVYSYHKNDGSNDGRAWTVKYNATCLDALQDEQWDIIVIQDANYWAGLESRYDTVPYMTVLNYLYNHQDVKPRILFHMTWTNPDDYETYINPNSSLSHPDQSWYRPHMEMYYSDENGVYQRELLFERILEYTEKYLDDCTDFLGEKHIEKVIPAATAVEYAHKVLGLTDAQLYRDWTHLNEYGRLIAAYTWYATIMGIDEITEVNVNAIPPKVVEPKSQYPTAASGYAITDDMKADLIESVNWALKNPYSLPTE